MKNKKDSESQFATPGLSSQLISRARTISRSTGLYIVSQVISVSEYFSSFILSMTQAIGKSRGGWNTKFHMVAASDREAVAFSLSPGNSGDGPQGRKLIATLGNTARQVYLLMDKAYEGDATVRVGALYVLLRSHIAP